MEEAFNYTKLEYCIFILQEEEKFSVFVSKSAVFIWRTKLVISEPWTWNDNIHNLYSFIWKLIYVDPNELKEYK